jgi:hypothetical protein
MGMDVVKGRAGCPKELSYAHLFYIAMPPSVAKADVIKVMRP